MNVNKMMKKISSYFPKHKKSDLEKKYEILEKLGTYVARLPPRRARPPTVGALTRPPRCRSPHPGGHAGAASGNFSVVKRCKDRETGKEYALKIIDKKLVEGKEEMIETECEILRRVKHPNIVSMIETFDTDDKLYLIMDLCVGRRRWRRLVSRR